MLAITLLTPWPGDEAYIGLTVKGADFSKPPIYVGVSDADYKRL